MPKISPNEIKQACNELAECMMVEHALQEQEVTVTVGDKVYKAIIK